MASIRWDDAALRRVIGEAARPDVEAKTREIESAANAMGSGFRTGLYHRDHKSPAVGDTPASYAGDVRDFRGIPVGIVHTGNYAAMRDNAENNTLLKSIG